MRRLRQFEVVTGTLLSAVLCGPVAAFQAHRAALQHASASASASALVFRQVLENDGDLQYLGNLTIGGQVVKAVFDTGSLELLVLSKKCGNCGDTDTLYDPAHSRHHKYGNMSVSHNFASGTLYSQEAYDFISAGPLQAETRAPFFEVHSAEMPMLGAFHIQSIAGLTPLPSPFRQMTLHSDNNNAYATIHGAFGINEFSFCLGRRSRSAGYLTWNDDVRQNAPPHTFSELKLAVDAENPHWTAKLENVRLGDDIVGCEGNCIGIVDSGTSILAIPPTAAEKLVQMIADLHSDCSDLSTLPPLRFKLGGVELSLPPESYVYHTGDRWKDGQGETVDKSCTALIMSLQLSEYKEDAWILGVPFLRKYYTVFEPSSPRLFVAEADADCSPRQSEVEVDSSFGGASGDQILDEKADQNLEGQGNRQAVTTRRPHSIDVKRVRWPTWVRGGSHAHRRILQKDMAVAKRTKSKDVSEEEKLAQPYFRGSFLKTSRNEERETVEEAHERKEEDEEEWSSAEAGVIIELPLR